MKKKTKQLIHYDYLLKRSTKVSFKKPGGLKVPKTDEGSKRKTIKVTKIA